MSKGEKMKRNRKRKKYFKKTKRTYLLIIIWLLSLVALTATSLNMILFNAQKKERMTKIKDYSDYLLIYLPQNRCELRKRWTYQNMTFYFDCIDHINLFYKSVEIPLEEMIKKELITLDIMLAKTTKEKEEEKKTTYIHEKTKDEEGYYIIVKEKEENHFDVIFRPLEKKIEN